MMTFNLAMRLVVPDELLPELVVSGREASMKKLADGWDKFRPWVDCYEILDDGSVALGAQLTIHSAKDADSTEQLMSWLGQQLALKAPHKHFVLMRLNSVARLEVTEDSGLKDETTYLLNVVGTLDARAAGSFVEMQQIDGEFKPLGEPTVETAIDNTDVSPRVYAGALLLRALFVAWIAATGTPPELRN